MYSSGDVKWIECSVVAALIYQSHSSTDSSCVYNWDTLMSIFHKVISINQSVKPIVAELLLGRSALLMLWNCLSRTHVSKQEHYNISKFGRIVSVCNPAEWFDSICIVCRCHVDYETTETGYVQLFGFVFCLQCTFVFCCCTNDVICTRFMSNAVI